MRRGSSSHVLWYFLGNGFHVVLFFDDVYKVAKLVGPRLCKFIDVDVSGECAAEVKQWVIYFIVPILSEIFGSFYFVFSF